VSEPLLERERLPALGIFVIVRQQQPTGPALGENVELNHVDVVGQGRIEAGVGIPRGDQIGALVTHPAKLLRNHLEQTG
jgi:hypothetical protein